MVDTDEVPTPTQAPRRRRVRAWALGVTAVSLVSLPTTYLLLILIGAGEARVAGTSAAAIFKWSYLLSFYGVIAAGIILLPALACLSWESICFRRPECLWRRSLRHCTHVLIVAMAVAVVLQFLGVDWFLNRIIPWLVIASGALLSLACALLLARIRIYYSGHRLVARVAAIFVGVLSLPATTFSQLPDQFELGIPGDLYWLSSFVVAPLLALLPPTMRRPERRGRLASLAELLQHRVRIDAECPHCGSRIRGDDAVRTCQGCGLTLSMRVDVRHCRHGHPVARGVIECASCSRTEDRNYASI